jgi:hypothetical protein
MIMTHMQKIYLILICSMITWMGAKAQVMLQFNPSIDGTNLDRIGNVHILYSQPGTCQARLQITVTKNGVSGALVKVVTPVFQLHTGLNIPGSQVLSSSVCTFQPTPAGQSLAQTHRFYNGEYEYCYELTLVNFKGPNDFFENCFDYTLQVMTPLLLVDPYDKETTCNRRPNLLWQPVLPMQPSMSYTLILSEEAPGQSKAEAINFNKALIFQSGIAGNSLIYPPQAPDLDSNRTFAWQVWGIQNNTIVTKSEIWEFTVSCSGDSTSTSKDSYRELVENVDASSYLAKGMLHFSYYNSYGPYNLNYSIVDLSKQNKVVKNLPLLVVIHGYNKYDIDLSELTNMNAGDQYLLKVKTTDGKTLQLKFVYSE